MRASQKAEYTAKRDDLLKMIDKDKTKKSGKSGGKQKKKEKVAVGPGRKKTTNTVVVAGASPASTLAAITSKYTELKKKSPQDMASLDVAMNLEIERICASQESSQSAVRKEAQAVAMAKARDTKHLRAAAVATKKKKQAPKKRKECAPDTEDENEEVPKELAAASNEESDEESDEENFVCGLNHKDTANFGNKIETKASAGIGYVCHLLPCRICNKRFFSKTSDGTGEEFLVPTKSAPAHICSNEGKGCREAMCHKCFDLALIGVPKRGRRR